MILVYGWDKGTFQLQWTWLVAGSGISSDPKLAGHLAFGPSEAVTDFAGGLSAC